MLGRSTPQIAALRPGSLVRTWDALYAIVVTDRGEWVLIHVLGEQHTSEYQRWQVTAVPVIEAECEELDTVRAGWAAERKEAVAS